MTLDQMLEQAVSRYGQKTAIILNDRSLSYAELDKASNKVANALIGMGLRKGDCVAMLLSNNLEFAPIYFGIVKAGGIAIPMDTHYKVPELDSLFANCQPKILVTEDSTLKPLVPTLPRFQSVKRVINVGSESGGQSMSYEEIMATSSPNRVEVRLETEDIATVSYSGGPTYHPRGAMLSHHSLISEAIMSGDGFEQTDKDVVMLFALPMYHNIGLAIILLTSLYKGSTVVIVPGTGLSLGTLLATIERERGTMFLGVPYIFALLTDMAEREGVKNDLSSLRLCGSAGAPLPVETIKRFKQFYGFDLIDFYGQTEAVAHVTFPPANRTGKLGSVGKALSGWELKIVDNDGHELPPNQTGEIIIRGPVMKGYYNNPEATAEVMSGGWLHTNDLGRMDEDNFLYITGLKKDMIIVKGQNIYPSDIEAVLYTHPKVAEAAVVGIPDRLRGETIRAVISLKAGQEASVEELRQFCQKYIADYKVPKQVLFRESLPKTADGRIRKEDLKKLEG